MARLVLSRMDVVDFTPKEFRGKEGAPKFKIAAMDGPQRKEVNLLRGAGVTGDGQAGIRSLYRALAHGLRGWENVENQDGKPAPWPGNGETASLLLPLDIIVEVGSEIITRSEITGEQRGN